MDTTKDKEQILSDLLIECRLNSFVSTKKIRHWLEEGCFGDEPKKDALAFLPMLTGLIDPEVQDSPNLLEQLVNALLEFYDTVPQKALGGKSPKEKSDEVLGGREPESLRLGMMTLPPHDWIPFYEQAMTDLHRKRLSDAAGSFDRLFEALLLDRTTARDIYRIFANAGLAYMFRGDPRLAQRCWEAALALNPRYSFARDQLDKLGSGDFDELITIGLLNRTKDTLDVKTAKPGRITPELVDRWSEDAILKKLGALGIKVGREGYIAYARTSPSMDELANGLLYPQIKGVPYKDPDDEDFIWMAARRLWRLWCPDEPCEDILEDLIEEAHPICLGEAPGLEDKVRGPAPPLADALKRISDILMAKKPGFIEHWKETYTYITEARDDLVDILCIAVLWPGLEPTILKVAALMKMRDPSGGWELVEIASLLRRKDPLWMSVYSKMRSGNPYNCYLPLKMAHILEDAGDDEAADDCLKDALDTVDLRARKEVWDLETTMTTIYEDYCIVLDDIGEAVKGTGARSSMEKTLARKRKDVEARREAYSFSPWREESQKKMSEAMKEIEDDLASKSPAMRYYEYLGRFGINFRTPGPVEVELSNMHVHSKDLVTAKKRMQPKKAKAGCERPPRKGPCPCGSGRMYKNCCGGKH